MASGAELLSEDLSARLRAVERRARIATALGLAGVLLAAATAGFFPAERVARRMGWIGPAPGAEIRVQRLTLEDAGGRVLARLESERGTGPRLTFFDDGEHERATVGTSGMVLRDQKGERRAALRLIPELTAEDDPLPVLQLLDPMGRVRTALMIGTSGSARLSLTDAAGKAGTFLETQANGNALLAQVDEHGGPSVTLGTMADGSRSLSLTDADGHAATVLGVGVAGSPLLTLVDGRQRDRLNLSLLPDGTPAVDLLTADGKSGASLGLTADDAALLRLSDRGHQAGLLLAAAEGAAALTLRSGRGNDVAALATDAEGAPRLLLAGDGTRGGTLLGVSEGGASRLTMFDAAGRLRAAFGQIPVWGARSRRRETRFSLLFFDKAGRASHADVHSQRSAR